jgi:hypothetical protein
MKRVASALIVLVMAFGALGAQAPFLVGVKALYNFEFGIAAEAFQEAQKADPAFALGYGARVGDGSSPSFNPLFEIAPDTWPDAAGVLLDSAIQIDQDAIAIDELGRIGFADDVAAIVDSRRERIVDVVPGGRLEQR